ncbi:unnamed protein product [Choristocarpus tenellus]
MFFRLSALTANTCALAKCILSGCSLCVCYMNRFVYGFSQTYTKVTIHALSPSDVPTKQFIMSLNSKKKCVISDLDATHVFVKADAVDEIRERLDEMHEKNVYVRPR